MQLYGVYGIRTTDQNQRCGSTGNKTVAWSADAVVSFAKEVEVSQSQQLIANIMHNTDELVCSFFLRLVAI